MAVSGPAKSCQLGCYGCWKHHQILIYAMFTNIRIPFVAAYMYSIYERVRTDEMCRLHICESTSFNAFCKTFTCASNILCMRVLLGYSQQYSRLPSKYLSPFFWPGAQKKGTKKYHEIYFVINSAFFYVVRKLRWGKGKHFSSSFFCQCTLEYNMYVRMNIHTHPRASIYMYNKRRRYKCGFTIRPRWIRIHAINKKEEKYKRKEGAKREQRIHMV